MMTDLIVVMFVQVFIVKQGKVMVTIHKTKSILQTDDTFFVPAGEWHYQPKLVS